MKISTVLTLMFVACLASFAAGSAANLESEVAKTRQRPPQPLQTADYATQVVAEYPPQISAVLACCVTGRDDNGNFINPCGSLFQ